MKSETRNCQNCKKNFVIEVEDFNFYKKIDVPPPTFCWQCRMQRRMAFRNTHSLYKRKDSFSKKEIISIYSPDKKLVVVDQKTWWSDSWDPFDYGRDYDFSRPFFEQWKEFRDNFPLMSLSNSKAVNSDYCNVAEESKDSYLCSASWKVERCMYSDSIKETKDCIDVHVVFNSEFSYEDVSCLDSYQLFYSQECSSCTDSYFLYDCVGCTSCFMSSNLRNKSYVMYNKQLTKEEYQKRINEMSFGSFNFIQEKQKEFEELKLKSIHRFAHIINSKNVTGNNLEGAKNCHHCFDLMNVAEDCKYTFWGGINTKSSYDAGPGIALGEYFYEMFDTGGGNSLFFDSVVYYSHNVEYSFNCYNCSDLFACMGLRSKQYCIFNKQYTKEEYFKLLAKIKKHMSTMSFTDKQGREYKYGEFFPIELSPFCYNETIGQDYFPLTKEEALSKGFSWKDPEPRAYEPTVLAKKLSDNIEDVSNDILEEVIECEHKGKCQCRCTTAFKILPNELLFYKRFSIPLPRLCYGCRHQRRFEQRKPMNLWHRQCMCKQDNHNNHKGKCEVEFETPYAPERPETIYCEKCYQNEVY